MAQLLASHRHGKRKDAIIAFLAALYEVYEATEQVISPMAIHRAITAHINNSQHPAAGGASVEPQRYMVDEEEPARRKLGRPRKETQGEEPLDEEPLVVVTDSKSGKKASAAQVMQNLFANGAKYNFLD